jgi:hypothetical protein
MLYVMSTLVVWGSKLIRTVCGNTIANGGAPATSGCSMLCNGNSSEICGGPDRLNVYNYQDQYDPTVTTTAVP